jgi:hypothetical protein
MIRPAGLEAGETRDCGVKPAIAARRAGPGLLSKGIGARRQNEQPFLSYLRY